MKKYDSIKKINLMHRQSVMHHEMKRPLWRFQSSSRSSNKKINQREQCQNMECLTDRLRPTKINQFTISTPTPTPDSFQPNTFDYSLQSPKSSQPLISYPTFPSIPTIATLPSSSVPPLPLPLPVPVPYSKTSNIQTYIRFKPFTKNQLMSFNCDTFPMNQSNNSAIGINIIDDKNITVELSQGNNNNISNNNNNNNSSQNSVYQSQQSQQSISSKLYTFDHIFGPQTSQKNVYENTSKELVRSFINGYNGTIFAYGQTGSGKTYTMFGDISGNYGNGSTNQEDSNVTNNNSNSNNMGIIPLTIDEIFTSLEPLKQQIKKITLSCSMCQIYKQIICDLMHNSNPLQSIQQNQSTHPTQKQIKIKDNQSGSIQIQNLTIKQITHKNQLLDWINKSIQLRKVRETQVNQRSSRSHYILTLYLNVQINDSESRVSKLNLVDLAGSQKISKTKVSGEGLEEAIKINLSLSCLGNAIYALSRGQEHVPFRDSKLTRILQESLSGNSLTRVIVTCSLSSNCKQETLSSLQFANRIKKIKTSSSINLKQISQQGQNQSVNKLMYQTLKNSYQNCQEKLQKVKYFIQNCAMRVGKQEIIQCVKNIVTMREGTEQQNEFLGLGSNSKQFQTFRSPYKQKQQTIITESYDHEHQPSNEQHENDERENNNQRQVINNKRNLIKQTTNIRNEPQNQFLMTKHVNNLQTILIKQQKIIENQTAELQMLRKQLQNYNISKKIQQQEQQSKHMLQQDQKNRQKLRILKTMSNNSNNNNNSSSIASKLKQIKSKSKHNQQKEQSNNNNNNNKNINKVSPFVTKFQHSSHSHSNKKQDNYINTMIEQTQNNQFQQSQVDSSPIQQKLQTKYQQRLQHQSQIQQQDNKNNKKQYTNMEKQILDKQVRALAKHIQQLNKIIIQNGLENKLSKFGQIDNFKIFEYEHYNNNHNNNNNNVNQFGVRIGMGTTQSQSKILYKKLKQKDEYINQLLQLLELTNNKIQINNNNDKCQDKSKRQSMKQSIQPSYIRPQNHSLSNNNNHNNINRYSKNNEIRNLSSMASPTTSTSISRVSSTQLFTKI